MTHLLLVQIIQRQLEQVEEKQRRLEERGVAVEKALRGEAGTRSHTFTPVDQGVDKPNALVVCDSQPELVWVDFF